MTKQKFLFLLLFFIATTSVLKAQEKEHEYIPLLDTGKVWIEAMRMEFGDFKFTTYGVIDTLSYNDTLYYIVRDIYGGPNFYLREDTIERKVYGVGLDLNAIEVLGYDFSLEVGDSILLKNNWFWVDSVSYIKYNNIERKVIYFYNRIWVEGIGSLAGIFNNDRIPGIYNMGETQLNCYYYNDELLYQSETATLYGCNFEELPVLGFIDDLLKMYPNPVTDYLIIELNNPETLDCSVEIFDLLGEKFFQTELNSQKTEINLQNIPKGIYLIRIYNQNKLLFNNKLMKQ